MSSSPNESYTYLFLSQEAFMENYIASQRDHIFRNVEVLIYVFDVESRDYEKDMHYYQSCLEALLQHSKSAKVFCLVHKMDLVQEEHREQVKMTPFSKNPSPTILSFPLSFYLSLYFFIVLLISIFSQSLDLSSHPLRKKSFFLAFPRKRVGTQTTFPSTSGCRI